MPWQPPRRSLRREIRVAVCDASSVLPLLVPTTDASNDYRQKLRCVAVRMRAPPVPRAADDRLERGKLRLPVQIALDAARARHQHGGITGTPRHFARRHPVPRHAASRFDNFANAIAAAMAEILDEVVALTQSIEHQNMRAGEIADMNVITDAGAIGSGLDGANDRVELSLLERNLQRMGSLRRIM